MQFFFGFCVGFSAGASVMFDYDQAVALAETLQKKAWELRGIAST